MKKGKSAATVKGAPREVPGNSGVGKCPARKPSRWQKIKNRKSRGKATRNRSKAQHVSMATVEPEHSKARGYGSHENGANRRTRQKASAFFDRQGKGNRKNGCLFDGFQIVSVGYVGKQCHLTRSLDRGGELSLMKSAGAANASRKDLRSFGNEFPKFGNILVIDLVHLVLAEEAYFLSSVHRTEGGTGCIVFFHVGKNLSGSPYRIPSRVVSLTHEGKEHFLRIRREGSRHPGSLRNWSPACC